MCQLSLVQKQLVVVSVPLGRLSVDHEDSRDLSELSKDDFVFVFDSPDDSMLEKVPIPLIVFIGSKFI